MANKKQEKLIEKYPCIFTYNKSKHFLIVVCYLIPICLAILTMLKLPWFVNIIIIVLLLPYLYIALEVVSFKKLVISDDSIMRISSVLKTRNIKFSNLKADTLKYLWTGIIRFREPSHIPVFFEMFPIGNSDFLHIRKILIEKNITDSMSGGWNW